VVISSVDLHLLLPVKSGADDGIEMCILSSLLTWLKLNLCDSWTSGFAVWFVCWAVIKVILAGLMSSVTVDCGSCEALNNGSYQCGSYLAALHTIRYYTVD